MRKFVLAFAFSTLLINPALSDRFFPLEGGPGGSDFRASCGSGSVVVGLRVRWGAWIDQFSLRCASLNLVDGEYRLGERFAHTMTFGFSTGGGHVEEKYCLPGYAVTYLRANTVEYENTRVLNYIEIACRPVEGPYVRTDPIRFATSDALPVFTQVCETDNFVSAVITRAWTYVDAVGIVCMSKQTLIDRRGPQF